jgi:thiol-disulfide isomerase/thioredoxin
MKTVRTLAPLALALLAACSSSTSSTGTSSGSPLPNGQDPGVTGTGDTTAASAPDKNPGGVPYPTTNIGTNARSGSTPGNTMANFKFLGYPDGDISKGLQPMSMANFFDPKAEKYRMVRIQASGTWCIHCQKETQTVAPLAKQLADRKVAWVISLAEGPTPGTASTTKDLNGWINEFKAPYTHFLDPANHNLGQFYDAAALPWNATLDARTMEIVDAHVGGIENEKDMLADVDALLAKISAIAIK